MIDLNKKNTVDKTLAGSVGSAALPGMFLGGIISFFTVGEKFVIPGALLGWVVLTAIVYKKK